MKFLHCYRQNLISISNGRPLEVKFLLQFAEKTLIPRDWNDLSKTSQSYSRGWGVEEEGKKGINLGRASPLEALLPTLPNTEQLVHCVL